MKWLTENYKWLFDGIGVVVLTAVVGYAFRVWHRRKEHKLAWPKGRGAHVAVSSEAIPAFPDTLTGFRPAGEDKDFWSKPFPSRGSIRVSAGDGWKDIPKFPNTMNGCSHGVFMIRWRSAGLHVQSTVRYSAGSRGYEKSGSFGYMSGNNCEQPMFRFGHADNGATLVDVFYELRFWQAAP